MSYSERGPWGLIFSGKLLNLASIHLYLIYTVYIKKLICLWLKSALYKLASRHPPDKPGSSLEGVTSASHARRFQSLLPLGKDVSKQSLLLKDFCKRSCLLLVRTCFLKTFFYYCKHFPLCNLHLARPVSFRTHQSLYRPIFQAPYHNATTAVSVFSSQGWPFFAKHCFIFFRKGTLFEKTCSFASKIWIFMRSPSALKTSL